MNKEKKGEGKVRVKVVILMVMMMVMMGCNSGGRDPEKVFLSEMVNLGKGFMEVFVSFGDMITGTLGIKAETKKSEIGKYFSDIEKTMNSVKSKLNAVVAENGDYSKVKEVVEQFINGILDKVAEGAKEAASGIKDASGNLGDIEKAADASKGAEATSVINLVKGIKTIVDVVLKPNEGDGLKDVTKSLDDDKKKIGKLFGDKTGSGAEEKHIAAASASIGAVSGVDILQAIAKSSGNVAVGKASAAKDAAGLAMANGDSTETTDLDAAAKKDAVMSAGIALRAMAKNGKFIVKDDAANKTEAEGAKGVSSNAVSKVLSTLTIAIRNRVDEGLKEINKVLGEIKQG
ncbi:variable large family protein [Borrelia duttonii]|uniref:Variable large protein n=1 Tax=Borrelia duttonii (strain Ly) TaxID=412419 RepID=B5RNL9_BORDL|nr:vlp protein, delta subfamily [Borrelia duttonii Ly]